MINFLRIANRIKIGDYLHQDGTIDDRVSSDIVGICVIPSNFLPDSYARFISPPVNYSAIWGERIKLRANQNKCLPTNGGKDNFGYFRDLDKSSLMFTSPYLPDNSFNPDFLRDLEGDNAFQDFKGYENTKIYWEKYSFLREVNCFNLCFKEAPLYRKEDWYLPAIGELACIPPRFEIIVEKIVEASYEEPGFAFKSYFYWSSTETDNNRAWYIGLGLNVISQSNNRTSSIITKGYKAISNLVQPFLVL